MSEETVTSRLAQVIYIIGCIASVVFVIGLIAAIINYIDSSYPDANEIIAMLALACVSYGSGWSIRFIVTGNTKSVIDRLKR